MRSPGCSGTTMADFTLPDLGEGLEEAEIVAWHVQVGDRVEVDQVIAEVETAKAVVEVPVPYAGVVAKLHAAAGDTVAVGRPLITVTADEAGRGFREPGIVVPSAPAPSGADDVSADDSGNVLVGYGTSADVRRNRPGLRRAAARAPVQAVPASTAPEPRRSGPVPVISPLVRKLARDAGLDLNTIAGTGPSGLVRRDDLQRAIAERDAAAAPAAGWRVAGRHLAGRHPDCPARNAPRDGRQSDALPARDSRCHSLGGCRRHRIPRRPQCYQRQED
jgi:2-oxoisovalerate dehydrogenase E2 component (dihydrolipoyl transacylase)